MLVAVAYAGVYRNVAQTPGCGGEPTRHQQLVGQARAPTGARARVRYRAYTLFFILIDGDTLQYRHARQ